MPTICTMAATPKNRKRVMASDQARIDQLAATTTSTRSERESELKLGQPVDVLQDEGICRDVREEHGRREHDQRRECRERPIT